jgi:hypothetical protein
VPESITIDRGKVYVGSTFMNACERLQISVTKAAPRTPTDKPHIERLFAAINTGFTHYLAGYAGANVLESTQFTLNEYNVPAADFAAALSDSDISFTGADFTASDLANALENGVYFGVKLGGGELTGEDVTHLLGRSINLTAAGIDPDQVADVLNGEVAAYSAGLPELGSVYSVTDFGWASPTSTWPPGCRRRRRGQHPGHVDHAVRQHGPVDDVRRDRAV